MAKAFRDLLVWQRAMDLTTDIYRLTANFPSTEVYGLTSQMRRAAVSIASNIAEGCGRVTKRDFRSFVAIAQGSCYELQTQLLLSRRLDFADEEEARQAELAAVEISKMLSGLSKYLSQPN